MKDALRLLWGPVLTFTLAAALLLLLARRLDIPVPDLIGAPIGRVRWVMLLLALLAVGLTLLLRRVGIRAWSRGAERSRRRAPALDRTLIALGAAGLGILGALWGMGWVYG